MKIFYVLNDLSIGGTETHVLQIASAFNSAQDEANVFAFNYKGVLHGDYKKNNIDVFSLFKTDRFFKSSLIKLFSNIMNFIYFIWILNTKKYDIIHFFTPKTYIALFPFAYLLTRSQLIMSRRSL